MTDMPRIPPQSLEAEQAVLGGLMLSPAALDRIADILTEADFYRRDHRLIYSAICRLSLEGSPVDAVTLGEALESEGLSEQIGGTGYLIELASTTPSAANIRAYAEIVRDKAMLRRLIEVGTEMVNRGFDPDGDTATAIVDWAVGDLMALSKAEQSCEFTLRQAIKLAWDDAQVAYEAEGRLRGITTGYAKVDNRLGGWHAGDLVFIGARPSVGKTALMVNLALNAAKAGHSCGIISGEQSAMQLGQRSLSVDSRVPAEVMRNGRFEDEHWPKLSNAMARLVEQRIRILDRSAPALDEIVRVARKWKREHGLSILFVDYLQRIRFKGAQNRIEEVSEVARALKTLARDLEIPVVCLAQVKAEVDRRPDKRPGLGDIANSDEATREADQIAFLYRDEVYNPESQVRGMAELNFEKNRHGPTGQFLLHFDGKTMLFSDYDDY